MAFNPPPTVEVPALGGPSCEGEPDALTWCHGVVDMTGAERALDGLWEHQREVVELARRYVAAAVDTESALITMPTGTGKSGVIAAITTCLPEVTGHRLVLTPWDALVRQMIDDLGQRFWQRLPAELRPPVMPVRRLPPYSQLSTLGNSETTIYVATIAAISVAARNAETNGEDLSQMFACCGCVLVDEGHYEPAANWSTAIRSLQRPTVLLTATPYRNDRKYFHVENWRYRFTHHEAVDKKFLREPELVQLQRNSDPAGFAEELSTLVNARSVADETRVIVRCATAGAVTRVVKALRARGETAVGIHERFRPEDAPDLLRTVPRTDENDAKYWVHQYKLIEGIDDPRFKVLAFFDSLKNGRAIVQQIGRVLRNPTRDPQDVRALVATRGDRSVRRNWESYRIFDRQNKAESVATLPGLIEQILQAQSVSFYYDGAYRSPVDLNSGDAWRDFVFPLRTRIFRHTPNTDTVSIDEIADAIAGQWNALDRTVYQIQRPSSDTRVIPYIRAANSRLLREATFVEPTFGYTVIKLDDDLLFFYDTAGASAGVVDSSFGQLRPPELQALFPRSGSQLTSVALLNTDVGRQAPRSRLMRAAAIADLAPDLADYAYVCTVAEGYTEVADNRFRRYVGMSRSRVNDFRSGEGDFVAYTEWLSELRDGLASASEGSATFSRYATYIDEPPNKAPANILLDIDPAMFRRELDGEVLQLADRATDVASDGTFTIAVGEGACHEASIRWSDERSRYEISSPSLSEELYIGTGDDRQELISLVNSEQLLRIVPWERQTIYAHGNFFAPTIPVSRAGDFQLLDILRPIQGLADVSPEKGTEIVNDDWDPGSVFGMITALSPSCARTPTRR
jgi:superfamily II DNA or RNA helicase